jgi:hypothetical protein
MMGMMKYHKPVAKRKPIGFSQWTERHAPFSLARRPKKLVTYLLFFDFFCKAKIG